MLKDDLYSNPKFQLMPSLRYITTTGFPDETTQMSWVKSFKVASGTFVLCWVID